MAQGKFLSPDQHIFAFAENTHLFAQLSHSLTLATYNFHTPQQKDDHLTGFLTAHCLVARQFHI